MEHLKAQFNQNHYKLNLTEAPLFRLIVAPLQSGYWVGIQIAHHLIIDHFTIERLEEEIYAIINHQEDSLPTPILFRNLIATTKFGLTAVEHTKFFDEMLFDIEEPTLPFGLSDVHLLGNEICEGTLLLSQTLNGALRFQARRLQVTLATLCHLAFARFLTFTSGQEKVIFGTVLSGRLQEREENDRALGLWINTLPLRVDINKTPVELNP